MPAWRGLSVLAAGLLLAARHAVAYTPVEVHGKLSVSGNRIVGEHGQTVRLRGMSMFWSQWMGQYWNKDCIDWLVKDWKVSLIRAAMGVNPGGYLDHSEEEKAKLCAVVDAAIDNGIYVVIDWHSYEASTQVDQAKGFFTEMSKKYGKVPNVLFEIFNEPQEIGWGDTIKPYHEQLVPVIRKHSDNIIICGTRTWSQEVVEASRDPVAGENIAYTIHFYAASMGQDLRNKVSEALSNGVAIFATEWGTCEYTGDGALNLAEAQTWMDFFENNHISDANWAISDKSESCSALNGGAAGTGGWGEDQLTESGRWVRDSLRKVPALVPPEGWTPPGGGDSGPGGGGAGKQGGEAGKPKGGGGASDTCPGSFDMPGYGKVELVPTGWGAEDGPAPQIEVRNGGKLKANMGARAYFADECTAGAYDHKQYVAFNLLGKTLRYTTDVSGSGCGCNAAMYLVSMQQNDEEGECNGDFYCDANKVCGVNCAEIDIQENNMHAWHSTLHTALDSSGVGGGYGGGDGWDGPRDFGSGEYGPGARCIDTSKPFQVAVSFPTGADGGLAGMEVELTQEGKGCPLRVALRDYDGLGELGDALRAGMTPVVSYWSSDDMLWLDGKGSDGQGPCGRDDAAACTGSVGFSGFCVSEIGEECAPPEGAAAPQAPAGGGGAQTAPATPSAAAGTCPGAISLEGYGDVYMVNAKWNVMADPAGDVEVDGGKVIPHLKGRSYFAKQCSTGAYDPTDYLALNLLGKSIAYTVDLTGAGCGCNAAFYLVAMGQNQVKTDCSDYYCDANSVCGVSCAEIDIQEANQHAWHSTLHTAADGAGAGGGFGGGLDWNGPRDWDSSQYGPGASCIDTDRPFQVAMSFLTDAEGQLKSVDLKLSQKGSGDCPLKVSLGAYDGLAELSAAMAAGMTPVVSYWSADDMGWMDGVGADGRGPCQRDSPAACADAVTFYDFSVQELKASATSPTATPSLPTSAPSAAPAPTAGDAELAACPGAFKMGGYGPVEVVPTGWGSGDPIPPLEVAQGALRPHMGARGYFADSCTAGAYSNGDYLALELLGKTLRYTADVSGAGCGCNAAMYLVSMRQNIDPTICEDFYCDANEVCGAACTEIDIQEANRYAWHSTVHAAADGDGVGGGYGGGDSWNGPRDFTGKQYAPGGLCVDTSQPFEVAVSFPADGNGQLQGMYVRLSQEDHDCPLDIQVTGYTGMAELSEALAAGMTPVISYWGDTKMLWMDGQGTDGQGPCAEDLPAKCASSVGFHNFSVDAISAIDQKRFAAMPKPTAAPAAALPEPTAAPTAAPTTTTTAAPTAAPARAAESPAAAPASAAESPAGGAGCVGVAVDCRKSACCHDAGFLCYEKDAHWAVCREECTPGVDPHDPQEYQTPWSCRALGERTPGEAIHKRPATAAPDADDEVVVRLQAPGTSSEWGVRIKRSQIPSDWTEGRDVTLNAGNLKLRGEIVLISDGAGGLPDLASVLAGTLATAFAALAVVAVGAAAFWREEAHRSTQALEAAGVLQPSAPSDGWAAGLAAEAAGASAWAATLGPAALEAASRWLPGLASPAQPPGHPEGRSPGPASPGAASPGLGPSPGRRKLLAKQR